jgi:hypothetical protein
LLDDAAVAAIVELVIDNVQDAYGNQCGNEGFHCGAPDRITRRDFDQAVG